MIEVPTIAPGWYVLKVRQGREITVRNSLYRKNLDARLPLHTKWRKPHRHSKRRVPTKYPLFPRYVFVELSSLHDLHRALEVNSVSGYIGTATGQPLAVDQRHVDDFLESESAGRFADRPEWQGMRTNREYSEGDTVEVNFTQYAGMLGRCIELTDRNARILVHLFGGAREISIPVDAAVKY